MTEESSIQRRLNREIKARKAAEEILEQKAIELYNANLKLVEFNKQLEQEVEYKSNQLEQNELRYKSLVDEATDSIFNFSGDLKISFANPKTLELFDTTNAELIGKDINELVRPDYLEYARAFLTQFWNNENPERYVELPLLNKSNKEVWAGINLTYVQDSTGNYFNAIGRDITQRKLIEDNLEKAVLQLERSEHKYRGILRNMQLGIVELDIDRKIQEANKIFLDMIGFSFEELKNKRPADVYLADDQEPLVDKNNLDKDSSAYPVYDVKLNHKLGREISVLISLAHIYNLEGEITGFIAIHYDITQRQLLQEKMREAKELAESARKAEQKFLAVMTHEIRTPLNAILGMSHLLADTKLDEEQNEYVDLVKNAADMLQALVSDILDLSKIQAGKIDVKKENFDLINHLDNCLKTIQIKHSDPNVKLLFQYDNVKELWTHSDKKLIHQIVINLLDNAMKFTHQGEIILSLRKIDGNHARLSVTDTGIGIAKEKLDIIFKEFEQADDQIHGTYGGTGLGLSICQKLAVMLGSKLNVESKEGVGTTFSMSINIDEELNKIALSDSKELTKNISDLNILIAEDNAMNQKYITKLLDKKNIQYVIASNGVEAVRLASLSDYDIILMDLHMPEMDGFQATKAIKLKGKNTETPIIALTASTMQTQKDEAFEAGMIDFLSKPFSPTQLFLLLENYCDNVIKDDSMKHQKVDEIVNDVKFDEDLIKEYLGDDIEYQNEMFELFVETVSSERTEILEAFDSLDLDTVKRVLHKIKPTFQMVGLKDSFQLIMKNEIAASEGDKDVLKNKSVIIAEIDSAIRSVKKRIG